MSSGFIKRLFHLLLHFTINYSSSLHLNTSIHSINMKHILKWTPLEVCCSTLNYTVQFQGEYELYKRNSTWVDAYDCQDISETRCDLTHDLASNSDYSIRIKANCDGQKSVTNLPVTFNRRDTVLLPPEMTVNVDRDPIRVDLSTTLSDMIANLKFWKEGDEQNVSNQVIKTYPYHFLIADVRREEKICFRAEAMVEAINKSCSTDTQCVLIPKQTSDLVKPLMVSITVVAVVAVACILGWSATHFGPQIKQTFCHREPVPTVLLNDRPTRTPILFPVLLEPTDPLLLLLPTENHSTELQVE